MPNFDPVHSSRAGLLMLDALAENVAKRRRVAWLMSAAIVVEEKDEGQGALVTTQPAEPGNAAFWKHDPSKSAPRGAWGSWSFAYPAMYGLRTTDEEVLGQPDKLFPWETKDALDGDFLGLEESAGNRWESFEFKRSKDVEHTPQGVDAIVVASTGHTDDKRLLAFLQGDGPLVADDWNTGKYSSRVYDTNAAGELDISAGLDDVLKVVEEHKRLAYDMFEDARGFVYAHSAGGSGGSVVAGGRSRGVLLDMDWRFQGPIHGGGGSSDKHATPGPNGEIEYMAHLNPDVPWWVDNTQDGPLAFTKRIMPKPLNVWPYDTEVYLEWDADGEVHGWRTTVPMSAPKGPPVDLPPPDETVPPPGDNVPPPPDVPEDEWEPRKPMQSPYEIGAPSRMGVATAPADAGYDGRYGVVTGDGRGKERLAAAYDRLGGPPPMGTHEVTLGRHTGGKWSKTTPGSDHAYDSNSNAALFKSGTCNSVDWIGPPEIEPTGLWDDPPAANVSESGKMLYGGDASRPAAKLWLGGTWQFDQGKPYGGGYLAPEYDSTDTDWDVALRFLSTAGADRHGTFTVCGRLVVCGGRVRAYAVKTSSTYTIVSASDDIIEAQSSCATIYLPASPSTGQTHTVINRRGGDVTVDADNVGGLEIEGSTTGTVANGAAADFIYNGTEWKQI